MAGCAPRGAATIRGLAVGDGEVTDMAAGATLVRSPEVRCTARTLLVAKWPGAVKYEAMAIRWQPCAARARSACGTVGPAAEA